VKFSNQFNNVALKKFDAVHLDVLMAIASTQGCSRTSERPGNGWNEQPDSVSGACG
jgi:hypothetical protein